MNIIVYRDGEQSLHAMRRANLASTVLTYARNTEKSHTIVGHDFLNARYYDSQRGQFLSEDPVFWSKQNIADPQSLNSYSYANGNPIVSSDPSGRSVTEYQPYLPSGLDYAPRELIGSYRGADISSRGPDVSAYDSPFQCTAFASRFIKNQFDGASLVGIGNAVNYGNQSAVDAHFHPSADGSGSFVAYNNGGAIMPQENDIITWVGNVGGHPTGHVGVIAEVTFDKQSGSGMVYTVEQNFGYQQGLFAQPLVASKDSDGNTTYSVGSRTHSEQVQAWTRFANQSTLPSYTTKQYTPAPKMPAKQPN